MKPYEIDGAKRPTTRGECREGPRPCPWVSCRHHLLIEIAASAPIIDESGNARDARPTTIRLNRSLEQGVMGRRPGLRADSGAELVRAWIRDAVEQLEHMPHTCALDVAEANPAGASLVSIATLLGVTTAAVKEEVEPARDKLRDGLKEYADHAPADHEGNLSRAGGRW